jgi:hypothetical protein
MRLADRDDRAGRMNQYRLAERAHALCRALCPNRHLRTEATQHTATSDDRGSQSHRDVLGLNSLCGTSPTWWGDREGHS